jgi:hypothetical protein
MSRVGHRLAMPGGALPFVVPFVLPFVLPFVVSFVIFVTRED